MILILNKIRFNKKISKSCYYLFKISKKIFKIKMMNSKIISKIILITNRSNKKKIQKIKIIIIKPSYCKNKFNNKIK